MQISRLLSNSVDLPFYLPHSYLNKIAVPKRENIDIKRNCVMKNTVMIVDDNPDWVERVCRMVDGKYEVIATAVNGEDGLKKFNELHPSVVVLDLVMPVRDGFSFLDNVHKGNSKIVVLSALTQDAFINRASSSGADYYLIKPCSQESLLSVLDSLCSIEPKKGTTSTVSTSFGKGVEFVHLQNAKKGVDKAIEERITNIFITVGIPAHIKGYQFLREAIKMAVDNPEIINSISSCIRHFSFTRIQGNFLFHTLWRKIVASKTATI